MAELSDELVRRLTPVREVIHRARSTVFPVVGSGLSLGPPGKGLLGWGAFLARIIEDAREEDRAELRALLERGKYIEAASLLEHDLRAGSLAQYVQREFQRPRIPAPEVYQLVAKLPTDHFATTNYDPWLKNAVSQRERAAPRVYVPTDQGAFSDIAPGSPPLVLMLHGDADRPESCVLSQRAYRKTQYHPPFRRGMEALAAQRTFLFIGHSVTDPDLIAVLEEWAEIFSAGAHGAPRHVMLGAGIDRATALRLRELAVDPIEYGKSGDHSALPAVLRFLATPPGAGGSPTTGTAGEANERSDGTPNPSDVTLVAAGAVARATTGAATLTSSTAPDDAPALAAPESRPLRPRLLLAGPWFGVRKELQKELSTLASNSPENLLEAVRGKVESDGAVARAQLAAILRYDVIIDLSPWRAFERWMSVGFRDVEQALRPGFSAMPPDALAVFAFGEDGAPAAELAALLSGATLPSKLSKDLAAAITARLEHLQSELPALGDRLLAAAGEGVALAGSSEDHHALVRPWVTRVAVAAGGLCSTLTPPRWLAGLRLRHQPAAAALDGELTSPTIADYLRALRVVAGQVRLLGELRYRPLEDVFVELELHREGEERTAWRRRDTDANSDSDKDHAADLERERDADLERLREEEDTRGNIPPGRKLTAEQLLSIAPRLYLEGLAGTGKSTLLRWLTVLASRRAESGGTLPVWVELATMQGSRSTLAEELTARALATLLLPTTGTASDEIGAKLRGGNALLLLDGLDECSLAMHNMLATRLSPELADGCDLVLSARPLVERTMQLASLPRVQLHGLAPGGTRRFLRAYFGDAAWQGRLLEGLASLPDGERWQRTPVLLALAATHVASGRELPEHTLQLYDQSIDRLLALGAPRVGVAASSELLGAVRDCLRAAARDALLPERGLPSTFLARTALGARPERDVAVQSGMFSGGDTLRFAHLTLGEYLAAEARVRDARTSDERLAWLAAARARPELISDKHESLAIALALGGEAALQAALEEAVNEVDIDPEHARLSLVLRALAYGGEHVRVFVVNEGAKVIAAVAAVFQLSSGRFGEAERRIGALAERAVRGAQRWWPAEALQPLTRWKGTTGSLGAEVHILAWWLGANWPMPAGLRATIDRSDSTRLRAPLSKRDSTVPIAQRIDALRRIPFDNVRASAARALAAHPNALVVLAPFLRDPNNDVRAAAITALAGHSDARTLVSPFLQDSSRDVRVTAVRVLENYPNCHALLVPHIHDSDSSVRAAAVSVLTKHPNALALLKDADPQVRASAVSAVARHADALALVTPLLQDQDSDVRTAAVNVLASQPNDVTFLASQLQDPAAGVRFAAIYALARHPNALALLSPLLQDSDGWIRSAAIDVVAEQLDGQEYLVPLLRDPDPGARSKAVNALSSHPLALTLLAPFLQDSDWIVRLSAVNALANHSDTDELLTPLLQDPENVVRHAAASALARKPNSHASLDPLLRAADSDVRKQAIRSLHESPNAHDLLAPLLLDPDAGVRAEAVRALANHPDATMILSPALQDPDARVRAEAVLSLYTPSNPSKLQHLLIPLLFSTDAFVRHRAISGLTQHPDALRILPQVLQLPEDYTEHEVAYALAHYPNALPMIPSLLQDPEPRIRAAAILALTYHPSEIDPVISLLHDINHNVRAFAVATLANHSRAPQLILPFLQDPAGNVRCTTALAISNNHTSELSELIPLLGDRESFVRSTAISLLTSHPDAITLLPPLLQDRFPNVRAAALAALANHPHASTLLPPLLQDPDNDVRAAAVAALSSHPNAHQLLPPLLQDLEWNVRAAAVNALRNVRRPTAANAPPMMVTAVLEHALAASFGEVAPWDHTLAMEALPNLIRSPRSIHLSDNLALGQLALRWLLRRLTKTDSLRDIGDSKAASGPEVDDSTWQCFGHLYQEQLPEVGRVLWVHVQMGEYELAFWRDVPIAANVLRAYELARFVTTSDPTYVLLACVDVDPEHVRANIPSLIEQLRTSPIANLQQPPLLVRGPFYAFSLPHGEAPKELSAAELLFTADLGRRWPTLSQGEQEAAIDLLYRLARSAAVEPLMLISPLVALAPHLAVHPQLVQVLRERLPTGVAHAAVLLEVARNNWAALISSIEVHASTEGPPPASTIASRTHALADALLGNLPPSPPALTPEQVADQLDKLAPELPTLDGEDLLRLLGAIDAFWSTTRGAARTLLAKRVLAALEDLPFAEAPVQRRLSELLSPLRRYLHQQG